MSTTGAPDGESLLAYSERIKSVDRLWLWQLDLTQAKIELERVMMPSQWTICDQSDLIWPGDLGDEPEDPAGMTNK